MRELEKEKALNWLEDERHLAAVEHLHTQDPNTITALEERMRTLKSITRLVKEQIN